jgi:DNA-binding response OmpR family regulator
VVSKQAAVTFGNSSVGRAAFSRGLDARNGLLALRPQGVDDLGVPRRVLIVDDEPNIVLSLEFLMKQAGYEVRTAADGDAALAAIAEAPPELILLDVNMPRRSGYEVCEAVRANPQWASVRILMLTAKGRDIERQKGLALGANDYVTKPFSTREVVAKVRAMLDEEPG